MTFEEIKNDEQQYMMHTYGRFQTALVSGKGAVAKDVDGKEECFIHVIYYGTDFYHPIYHASSNNGSNFVILEESFRDCEYFLF